MNTIFLPLRTSSGPTLEEKITSFAHACRVAKERYLARIHQDPSYYDAVQDALFNNSSKSLDDLEKNEGSCQYGSFLVIFEENQSD